VRLVELAGDERDSALRSVVGCSWSSRSSVVAMCHTMDQWRSRLRRLQLGRGAWRPRAVGPAPGYSGPEPKRWCIVSAADWLG